MVWNPLGAVKNDGPAFQTFESGGTLASFGLDYMVNEDELGPQHRHAGHGHGHHRLDTQIFVGPVAIMAEIVRSQLERDAAPRTWTTTASRCRSAGCSRPSGRWLAVAPRSTSTSPRISSRRTFGLNYYVDRHNGKWMLEWDKLDTDGVAPDKQSVRVQYQVIF